MKSNIKKIGRLTPSQNKTSNNTILKKKSENKRGRENDKPHKNPSSTPINRLNNKI